MVTSKPSDTPIHPPASITDRCLTVQLADAVYLHELSDGFQAQRGIARWMEFYNTQRPHSALADSTPTEAYEKGMLLEMQVEPWGQYISRDLALQPSLEG